MILGFFLLFLASAVSALGTPIPGFDVNCEVTSRQGYSSEAAANRNPNSATARLKHTNFGLVLESTAKRTILMEDNGTSELQKASPSALSYFGKAVPPIEIGSGLSLNVTLGTDDVKSNPKTGWKGWTKSQIYSEAFRRNEDQTLQVVTSPSYSEQAQYWAPGTTLSAHLIGTEWRTALYNTTDSKLFTSEYVIQHNLAPEGFLIYTHIECTRAN